MQHFEKQEFQNRHDPDVILAFRDCEFVKCKFMGGGFGYRHSPDFAQRTSAANIRIIKCESQKFSIGPALLEDIYVENFRGDLVTIWGALFRHVTIKGRCDKLMIHGITGQGDIDAGGVGVLPYRVLCDEFYASVDWALDIRDAEFDDFSIRTRGVPAHLIRRDPETQAILRREALIEGKWRELGLSAFSQLTIKEMIAGGQATDVLVAPKRDKKLCAHMLEDIRKLRESGMADME
jgi:hypothetical protein